MRGSRWKKRREWEHQSRWEKVSVDDSKLRQVKKGVSERAREKMMRVSLESIKKAWQDSPNLFDQFGTERWEWKKSENRDNGERQKNKRVEKEKEFGDNTVTVYLVGKLRYAAFQLPRKWDGIGEMGGFRKNKIHISSFTDTSPSAFAILAVDSCSEGLASSGW